MIFFVAIDHDLLMFQSTSVNLGVAELPVIHNVFTVVVQYFAIYLHIFELTMIAGFCMGVAALVMSLPYKLSYTTILSLV